MNIIVVTNDGINISSPFSSKYHYKLFEIDRKELDLNSNKISELINKTEDFSRMIGETELFEILNSDKKKTVLITNNLSPHIFKQLRDSGVEIYITFKKSVNEALYQYYSDWFVNDSLYAKKHELN